MPRVLNRYRDDCRGSKSILRGTPWGNPFIIGPDGDRAAVIAKYRAWIETQPELIEAARRELRGRDLMCVCAPLPCHGDVLLEIANV